MAELKTKVNDESVDTFLKTITDAQKQQDCFKILEMMQEITQEKPKMWGSSMIGFGNYHYKYETGREGDWFLMGFSPRKQNITLYLSTGLEKHQNLLKDLGKHKIGKSCLYINKFADINQEILEKLIKNSLP
jgi:hypothetical protein